MAVTSYDLETHYNLEQRIATSMHDPAGDKVLRCVMQRVPIDVRLGSKQGRPISLCESWQARYICFGILGIALHGTVPTYETGQRSQKTDDCI